MATSDDHDVEMVVQRGEDTGKGWVKALWKLTLGCDAVIIHTFPGLRSEQCMIDK